MNTATIEKIKRIALIRVVDDDEDHCSAVLFMLESHGWRARSYASAKDFLTEDVPSDPGCLILDVHMPNMSGLEMQYRLKETHAGVPVIFLTGYGDVDMAVHTMHEGAADFFQKPVKAERLLAAVEKAARASVTLLRPFVLMTADEAKGKLSALTARELQVMELSAVPLSSRLIGERLGISERTVESHKSSACKKLQVHAVEDILQLLAIARQEQ